MKAKTVFAKFITLVVALQILNISIYAQDVDAFCQKNVLIYDNEINTVAEYIGEVILKHANEFPEYPNDGHKDLQFSKHIDINLFAFQYFKPQPLTMYQTKYLFPNKIDYNFLFFKEINPPPPKA
jgi:hypothetical protein